MFSISHYNVSRLDDIIFKFILCINVLPACMYAQHIVPCVLRLQKGVSDPLELCTWRWFWAMWVELGTEPGSSAASALDLWPNFLDQHIYFYLLWWWVFFLRVHGDPVCRIPLEAREMVLEPLEQKLQLRAMWVWDPNPNPRLTKAASYLQ